MHHVGTITKEAKFVAREFHGQCSCGTAGHFATRDEAAGYLNGHGAKIVALGATNTFELVDKSDEPEVEPVLPLTHAASAPIPEETPAPVEGQASEVVEPAAQETVQEREGFWPKKKKK